MSFIEDKKREFAQITPKYSIKELEQVIAEGILCSAKSDIEFAIKKGDSHCSCEYNHSDGVLDTYPCTDPDYYINRSPKGLTTLASFCRGFDYLELREAINEHLSELNLSNIENMVYMGISQLGAKQITVHICMRNSYIAKIEKSGFFQHTYVEEKRSTGLRKYKVCYTISW